MNNYRENLVASLRIMALPAISQLEYLRQLSSEVKVPMGIDELVLDFADQVLLLWKLPDLDPDVAEKLRSLDQYILTISGSENASLWTPVAVESSEVWEKIRLMSQDCLMRLGAPLK